MKTIFMTGKGGVGKSTLSSALAWQLARKGHRVLAVSLDPAHNLGDLFDVRLSHRRKAFADNLWLQEVDAETSAGDYLREHIQMLSESYGYLKAMNMDAHFKVLRFSPGIEEYAVMKAMEGIMTAEGYDYVVFDTPPTGLTLRILALPGITLTWLERLVHVRKQILDKRHTIHRIAGPGGPKDTTLPYREEDDPVMRKLRAMQVRFRELEARLRSDRTVIAVILNPDLLAARESERLIEGLGDLDLPPGVVFHNKVAAGHEAAAGRVERELLGRRPAMRIERVPAVPSGASAGYRMPYDLTAAVE